MPTVKPVLFAVCLFAPPALAQDMNTLNRHLEHQQWQRVQDHQNRARTGGMKRKPPVSRSAKASCTADALPVARRRMLEAEYARRAASDGKASADAWIREEGMRFRRSLKAKGVC